MNLVAAQQELFFHKCFFPLPPFTFFSLCCRFSSADCQGGEFKDPTRSCPHANRWIYTPLDAHLGQACQVGKHPMAQLVLSQLVISLSLCHPHAPHMC